MKKIQSKIIKVLLYSVLIIPFFVEAQTGTSEDKKYFKRTSYLSDNLRSDSLDLFIDSILKPHMQNSENCGVSIGISKNGKNYFYNYGEIKRGSKVATDKTTLYEIGALSTTFTGLLLAQAILEKKLSSEDDIRNYLPGKYPELQLDDIPVLIKHLANHTSGLIATPENLKLQESYNPLNPYATYSKEMLLAYLEKIKPLETPGTSFDYSNLGIAILGIILETVYEKSFDELVKEKICSKLGLKNTAVNLTGEQIERSASGYNQTGDPTQAWSLGGFQAAGGLKSTTEDLLNYLNYQLEEKDKAVLLTHQVTFKGRPTAGLAWLMSKTKKGNTLTSLSGGTFGFGAFNGFIKSQNCAVVILGNNSRSFDFLAISILNYLQK